MTEAVWISLGSLLVAVAAFFRNELQRLVGGWTNKVDFYPAAKIEVGFSDLGPTIGLHGSLRARSNNQLVKEISVTVTRTSDGARHNFDWHVFRKFNLMDTSKVELDIAAPFLLTTTSDKILNILFTDEDTVEKCKEDVLDLRNSFLKWCTDTNSSPVFADYGEWSEANAAFEKTEAKSISMKAYNTLTSEFYWKAGRYCIDVILETDNPIKKFNYNGEFDLSAEESETLSLNKINILSVATNIPLPYYNFANVVWVDK